MRILLIKTSSLGDVIHNLPVVTDLHARYPAAQIDWAVEEAFAEIPRLHPQVNQVFSVAWRRWRRSLLSASTWREIGALRGTLRDRRHDLVIDTQGLLKSAVVGLAASGRRCGYAATSAREPIAARFYDGCFEVPKDVHAVERNRRLAAQAAGYAIDSPPDYGIALAHASSPGTSTALLLTATSRADKLWPESSWQALGRELHQRGLACRLPAGSPVERARAERIAAAIPDAEVLPPLGLRDLAGHLAAARVVVGVDTGLVHLAAAVGRPTIALYCASDPALTGVLAATPTRNLGQRGNPPSVAEAIAAVTTLA